MINWLMEYLWLLQYTNKSFEIIPIIQTLNKNFIHFNNLTFFIGPPDPPTNCSVVNQTTDSLEVQCLPGFNGGLPQTFLLEVTDIQTKLLLANATDTIPEFTVYCRHDIISYYGKKFCKIAKLNLA